MAENNNTNNSDDTKDIEELKKKVEAVLYSAGRTVDTEELAGLCRAEQNFINKALKELKKELEERGSPLLLIEEGAGWKLTVGEKYLDTVKDITPHTELDKAILETLAVIAYKQPVLQSLVVKIRTSAAYEHISRLVEMGFISKEKKGRSFVLKPTGRFFDYFNLPSKDKLKELFKDIEEVEKEAAAQAPEEAKAAEGSSGEQKTESVEGLAVYSTTPIKEEKEKPSPDAEHFGKLEVVDYPEEKGEEEEKEEKQEEEKTEYDEERARRIIKQIAEEEEPEESDEAGEEKEEEPGIAHELEEFAEKKEEDEYTEEEKDAEEFEEELKKKKEEIGDEEEDREEDEEEKEGEDKEERAEKEEKKEKRKIIEKQKEKSKPKKKSFDELLDE